MKPIQKKDKPSLSQQIFIFQTQVFITIEHDYFHLCKALKQFFIIIGQLQIVSFLVTPTRSSLYQNNTMDNTINQYMNLIPLVTRPYTFLTQESENTDFRQYCFFGILFWILLMITTLLMIQLYFHKTDNKYTHLTQSERIGQLPHVVLLWIYFISWTLQMMSVILLVPAQELCLEAFALSSDLIQLGQTSQQSTSYIVAFLSILTLVLLFAIQIFRLFVTEETINLDIKGNEKLNLTLLGMSVFMIQFAQVLVFIFMTNIQVALYLQILCTTFIALITLVNILFYYSIYDQSSIKSILVAQSFNISMILVYLITNIVKLGSSSYIASAVLLNFGFFAFLLLRYKDELEITNIQPSKLKEIDDPAKLQYQIAQNLLDSQWFLQTTRGILLQTMIIKKHREGCEQVDCFCRKNDFQIGNSRRINYSNDKIQDEYCMMLIRKLNRCQKKIKNDQEKFSFILHYIAAISLIRMNTQAFQQTNIMIQKLKPHENKRMISRQESEKKNSDFHSLGSVSQSQSERYKENVILKIANDKQRKQLRAIQVDNIGQLTFIQTQKIKTLQSHIKHQINQNVSISSSMKSNAEEISYAVTLLLSSESSNQNLKAKVVKLMQMKLSFYNLLTSTNNLDGGIIFKESQRISQEFYSTEQSLVKLYQEFPSQKIQSVICFFQAEIFNNYLMAYKISNVTTIADEKLMKMHRNLTINLFSNKITYLILGLEQENLVIQQTSNNAHEFFQYGQDEFKDNLTIDFLLPPALKKEHNIVVNEFLQSGKSKYFRNSCLNFCLRKDNFILPINFFYDINFSNLNSFSFATFFEQINFTSAYIMVDLNGYVGGVTRNFFEKMGIRGSDIKAIDVERMMYQTHISKILPKFNELVDDANSQDHIIPNNDYLKSLKYINIAAYVIRNEVIKSNFQRDQTALKTYNTHKNMIGTVNKIWDSKDNLDQYQLSCVININAIMGMRYYIIEIEELKQLKCDNITLLDSPQRPIDDTSRIINDLESPSHQGPQLEQEDLNWSKLIEPCNCDQSIEREINAPHALNVFDYQQDMMYYDDKNDKQTNQRLDKILYEDINILSPIESVSRIVKYKDDSQVVLKIDQGQNDDKQNLLRKLQQKYFIDNHPQSFENSSKGDPTVQQQFDQIVQYDVQGIDDEMKRNVQQMLQVENNEDKNLVKMDDGSQVSSIAGFRKSPFFKKYDVLMKVIDSKNNPSQFLAINTILTFNFFLVCIFSIIVSINIQQDLSRFLQEIDILQITNHFLAPNVQFNVERLAIFRYDAEFTQGLLTQQYRTQLNAYVQINIIKDYDTMKNNYVQQFSNVYLQEFLRQQYIVISLSVNGSSVIQEYNVTLRTSLDLLLNTVFLFKLSYQGLTKRSILYKGPPLYYQYKNLIRLIVVMESLSDKILVNTTQQILIISNKWYYIYTPFLIITILLTLIAWIFYKMYLRKLEQLMTMFRYITPQSIEQDKDRFKLLLNYLGKDSNLIFKYQFNLEQKEKSLVVIKQKKGQIQQNQNAQTKDIQINRSLQNLKLPILRSILVFIMIGSVFVVSSTIISSSTQTYLQKYSSTAILFKEISDLGFYLPNLFLARETLYNLNILSAIFIPQDLQAMYSQINLCYLNIQNFIKFLSHFKKDQYLISNQFIQQLQAARTQSLCQFLDPSLIASSQYYCNNSFNGVLKRGLDITLSSMIQRFQTEQQVNNFTTRSQASDLEIEGEFITQKVTEYLKTSLKSDLINLTQDQISHTQNLSTFLIFYSLIGIFMIYAQLHSYLRHEFMILKRLILLMPSTSLFFDDQFERQVRLVLVKENIV